MRRAGRFLWLDWAQASGRLYSSHNVEHVDAFEGEHDGYRNLGIKHRRRIQWLAAVGWVIVDDILGTGVHDARLHWLAADLPYEVYGGPFQVVFTLQKSRIRWNVFASIPGHAAVCRAGTQVWSGNRSEPDAESMRLLGWESPTYGEVRPAVSLTYQTRSQLPVRFVTVILTDERCKIESEREHVKILRSEAGNESELHRVTLSERLPDSAVEQISPGSTPRA